MVDFLQKASITSINIIRYKSNKQSSLIKNSDFPEYAIKKDNKWLTYAKYVLYIIRYCIHIYRKYNENERYI